MVVTPPRWLAPVTLLLAVVGLGVATFLTYEHYTASSGKLPGCSTGGTVDCGAVTTSAESHILGVPVALLGLLYFVAAIPFLLPVAWRSPLLLIRAGRLAGAISGLGFVMWLVYAELAKIHHICEYCTAVHILTLLSFVVITYGTLVTMPVDPALVDETERPARPARRRESV